MRGRRVRRRRVTVSALAGLAFCGGLLVGELRDEAVTGGGAGRAAPLRLAAHPAGHLPTAVQDASGASAGGSGLVLGGLDASDVSLDGVVAVRRGRARRIGALPSPLHDAAAAPLGGAVYVFGGGQAASSAQILRVDPASGQATPAGRMPQPRSDLAAATVRGTAYLIGGYTGSRALDTIVAWRPGHPTHVVGRLPHPLRYAAAAASGGRIVIAGGSTPTASRAVLVFDPGSGSVRRIGRLPAATTHAAAAALGRRVYVFGGRGEAGGTPNDRVLAIDPGTGHVRAAGRLPRARSDIAALPARGGVLLAGGRSATAPTRSLTLMRPASPAPGGHAARSRGAGSALRPGSDPSVLPTNVLIADRGNNRLLEVSPEGRIVWRFPRPGDLARGQSFNVPDDAFFSPNGKRITATQEDDSVISVVDPARHRITYRYGTAGVPGSGPNQVHNPDDALLLPGRRILAADIKNCRLVELRPPAHAPARTLGTTGMCSHDPPRAFASPNGAFPIRGGGSVVTEISGDWIDVLSPAGKLLHEAHPPGFSYPSDTNEVRPGLFVSADYADPGAVETFDTAGRLRWRFAPRGSAALNKPSLATPLPNGDFLVNDDFNDRVIVVDPRRSRIVWQYGHMGRPGTRPGYLNTPDGVDLAPPNSLLSRFPGAAPPR